MTTIYFKKNDTGCELVHRNLPIKVKVSYKPTAAVGTEGISSERRDKDKTYMLNLIANLASL